MNTRTQLINQAIQAAKTQNWQAAIEANQALLEQNPKDIPALNRLGVAFVQAGQKKEAIETFKNVLEIERSNPIAQKHLKNLKKNQVVKAPSFNQIQFIEEPGKTKTTQLHRLAGKSVIDNLSIGQECDLKPKNRYIAVEVDKKYIGSLPEDLSFRLTKLIKNGNKYSCWIKSNKDSDCHVYIREIFRSKRNDKIHSFCIQKSGQNLISSLEESYMSKEDVPVAIVHTDEDNQEDKGMAEISEIAKNSSQI